MIDKDRLIQDLIRDEGVVLHAYQDSLGFWTIGIGRLIDPRSGGRITKEEAIYLLNNDIERKEKEFYERYPHFKTFNEARQRALLNMYFNLGANRFAEFKKMITALKNNEFQEAARQALNSLWAKQVGKRAVRIATTISKGVDS